MPGSFPDPQSYANTALHLLEDAYKESCDTHAGSLILTAMEAIKRLKQEIRNLRAEAGEGSDPYEFNEFNSAI